jgi:hypothetical protein
MPGVRLESVTRENQRLVGGLLRVLARTDDPAVSSAPYTSSVSAVHVERVLGQRARRHSSTIVEHLPGAW